MESRENRQSHRFLVPENFTIDPRADLRTRMQGKEIVEGYPAHKDRLVMTRSEIEEWKASGMPYERAWKTPSPGHHFVSHTITTHPNYLDGLRRGIPGDDGHQQFSPGTFRESLLLEGYPSDSRGLPVHPYYDILLEEGVGVGPGWYWYPGPNPSASAIIPVIHKDHVYIPVVTKNGQLLLPGGMVEPIEKPIEAAIREAREEIDFGVNEEDLDKFTLSARILPSGRTTLNAWEETQSGLYVPKGLELNIDAHPLRPGDDIKEAGGDAFWIPLTSEMLNKLWFGHANDVREAILRYQMEYNIRLDSDGSVCFPKTQFESLV